MAVLIATADDFLTALREHPEWRDAVRREILGDEFYDLPATLDRLAATVAAFAAETRERFREMEQRFDAIDKRFGAMDKRFDAIDERFEGIDKRFDAIDERFEGIDKRFDGTDGRLNRFEGQLGGLAGDVYELKFNISARAGKRLRKVQIVSLGDSDVLHNALDDGRISPDQWDALGDADYVLKGRLDGREVYAAVEVSITVDVKDVTRASERAGVLALASVEAIAMVGGKRITRGAAKRAAELSVHVLIDRREAPGEAPSV